MNVIMAIWVIALGIAQLPFFFNLFASMPRRGGRAVASVFVAMFGGTTFAGLTYWNKFSEAQSVRGKLALSAMEPTPDLAIPRHGLATSFF